MGVAVEEVVGLVRGLVDCFCVWGEGSVEESFLFFISGKKRRVSEDERARRKKEPEPKKEEKKLPSTSNSLPVEMMTAMISP